MEYGHDIERIVQPYRVPQIFATRIGYVDMLPGGAVRFWLCVDQPGTGGVPGPWELQAHLIWSIEPLMHSRIATNQWLCAQGIHVPTGASMPIARRMPIIVQ